MTLEDSVRHHRLQIMQRAAQLRNVTRACQEAGISRTLFYRWRQRLLRYGPEGLRPRPTRPTRWPRQATPALEHAVLAYALLWPTHRPARIAAPVAPTALGSLATQCLGGLRHSQAPWLADAVGAADAPGGPRADGCGRGHRTHATPSRPPARGRGRAGGSGLPECVLRREAQRRRESLAADDLRCGLLVCEKNSHER